MSIQVSSTPETAVASKTSTSEQQRQAYLTRLVELSGAIAARSQSSANLGWLKTLRGHATNQLSELALPTTRDEAWRFTDISPLLQWDLQVPAEDLSSELSDRAIAPWRLPEASGCCLVFVNGTWQPQLSNVETLPKGVEVGSLSQLPERYQSQAQNYLGKLAAGPDVFAALNIAGMADVAVVWANRNAIAEQPIHLLFLATPEAKPTLNLPRCLIVAESGSALTVVEEYRAVTPGAYFTNAIAEIWLDENAQLNHTRLQREDSGAIHIGTTTVAQARDSRYTSNTINLGATIDRHNLHTLQQGEQTETTLNGLTIAQGERLADTHSTIAHTLPYGTSQQLHKCIVCDRARAVFGGKISVPHAAQLTNAAQLNPNLLLSPKARVNTKPQLEIVADNVKCSHGATVSQLEPEEVFYLQSRCLDADSARNLLIYAFAAEIVERIPIESLRQSLATTVRELQVQ